MESPNSLPTIGFVEAVFATLRQRLQVVSKESIEMADGLGRILAEPIPAFRDSPSMDVSAMDGFAVRRNEVDGTPLAVQAVATAGTAPLRLDPGKAIRILTGAVVPTGADAVIRREDSIESNGSVRFTMLAADVKAGWNIRYQGENARKGDVVLPQGCLLGPHSIAGAVTFSTEESLCVYRKLVVAILNTGDELIPYGDPIESWQIRDSNGPYLESSLKRFPWIECTRRKVGDSHSEIRQAIETALLSADVVLLTGGVSMGETDYVPRAIEDVGAKISFHRIPIRPGKPMLGASTHDGKLILGLPGNPLSVAVTFRRFGLPLLESMAGIVTPESGTLTSVHCSDQKTLDLVWFRLVASMPDGSVEVLTSQGSGDIASLAKSVGFVEVEPGSLTAGMRKFFTW